MRLIRVDQNTNFLQKDRLIQPNTAGLIEGLYSKLKTDADKLTKELGRPVSMAEVLLGLIESMKLEAKDLSWSWRINKTQSSKIIKGKNPMPGTRFGIGTIKDSTSQ